MPGLNDLNFETVLSEADEHHECDQFPDPDNHEDYGPAISDIVRLNDTWFATAKGEYSTPIKFCPFCAKEL